MMKTIIQWCKTHQRMVALKVIIAIGIIVNHFWPDNQMATLLNLLWLIAF